MPYFLDTSALVKLYLREAGTASMLRLQERASSDELLISALATVEFTAAVRVNERSGRLSPALSADLITLFHEHLSWRYIRQGVSDGVLVRAEELTRRHPLRAYDAVQLASALTSGPTRSIEFVCSDRQLLAAARAEGLECFDPMEGD